MYSTETRTDFTFGTFNFSCLLLQPKPESAITIAVSARVLFNMEREQQIYEQQGMEDYVKYQVEHETEPFSPGPAFSFVKVRAPPPPPLFTHPPTHLVYVYTSNQVIRDL